MVKASREGRRERYVCVFFFFFLSRFRFLNASAVSKASRDDLLDAIPLQNRLSSPGPSKGERGASYIHLCLLVGTGRYRKREARGLLQITCSTTKNGILVLSGLASQRRKEKLSHARPSHSSCMPGGEIAACIISVQGRTVKLCLATGERARELRQRLGDCAGIVQCQMGSWAIYVESA